MNSQNKQSLFLIGDTLPTFVFAGLDKSDLGGPGWSRRGLWSAIGAWWDASLPWGIPPPAAATLPIVTPASARASACTCIGTLSTASTAVIVSIGLIAVLLLVLRHSLPVPMPWRWDLYFPFSANSLERENIYNVKSLLVPSSLTMKYLALTHAIYL